MGLVRSQLKKREEAFTAEYRASASASGFWRNRLEAGWPLLHLYRMAAPGDTLLSLLLCPEQSEDGLAFRYRLEDFYPQWQLQETTRLVIEQATR